MEGSSLVKEAKEKAAAEGRAAGLAEGHTEGELQESRRLLRLALVRKHAGLESMPEIDQIAEMHALEAILLDQVLIGADRQSIEQAILAAVRQRSQ